MALALGLALALALVLALVELEGAIHFLLLVDKKGGYPPLMHYVVSLFFPLSDVGIRHPMQGVENRALVYRNFFFF
ncbi:hypothetical protein BC351_23655 [Paenibacillus ferrarius]|uniref:Uncharacterized protein n=1 Tax=Paenibacillus ferrarius TaxID=1469647 RepID=A0A1V4HLK7_9BACL|nr:hypothetical protein BC351_23655 [Paenibacillus ferrarius]